MIITDIIFFLVLLTAITGTFIYSIRSTQTKFKELKSKQMKTHILLKSMNKSISSLQTQISEQAVQLEMMKKNASKKVKSAPEEDILHGYSRAKGLVQRGMTLDENALKSCNLTEEELELLSDTLPE